VTFAVVKPNDGDRRYKFPHKIFVPHILAMSSASLMDFRHCVLNRDLLRRTTSDFCGSRLFHDTTKLACTFKVAQLDHYLSAMHEAGLMADQDHQI
jgi:hypothetical protein